MRLIRNSLVVFSIFACNLQAQTVISNNNLEFQRPGQVGRTFYFKVWQDASKTDFTGVDFTYNGSSIAYYNENLDEGSDWYVVHSGNKFGPSGISAGQFTPLVTWGPTSYPAAGVGTDFYLGVSTGIGYFTNPVTFYNEGNRTAFGWVHLSLVGGVVTMVDNAMSYSSPGIIVGTTTLVPEPSTLAMIVCAIPWCFAGRRWRRK